MISSKIAVSSVKTKNWSVRLTASDSQYRSLSS